MSDTMINDADLVPVSADDLLAVERFLFRESRLLNTEQQGQWLTDILHEDIRYQVYVRELRHRKDKKAKGPDRLYIYDETFGELDARVRQFETGMQWRVDPPERIRYLVSNIEAFHSDEDNELIVLSNCLVVRNRRVYEESTFVYGRVDRLRRDETGKLRLIHREVDYDQRYLEGRNQLFFV
jgi:naphthalene 1,2-dioxygenase subunit beta|tara:strand:- start:5473 stop:6018 length:546 start_codon:yes stop_codon:yes gene_type:complete